MSPHNITFFFENRRLQAEPGDSIAAALFRSGIRTLSYSVKYKRPRGIHCARGRCIMCHMEVDGVPGVPTCITPVRDGMRVQREDFRPFFAPLLISAARRLRFPAGFYYRMFTRPAFVRKVFLGSLRKMAGVGRLRLGGVDRSKSQSPAPTGKRSAGAAKAEYDAVVVGAGLSGMSAAVAAARTGASVLLVDEYRHAGGHSIGFQNESEIESVRDDLVAKTLANASIDYWPGTTAQALYPPGTLLLGPGGAVGIKEQGDSGAADDRGVMSGLLRVSAKTFVFANGAYDVIPLFDNNDTPGIFGPRAIRLFLERDGLKPGSRAVVYGTDDNLVDLTRYLLHHKLDIAAVVDASAPVAGRADKIPGDIRCLHNSRVVKASAGKWLSSVTVSNRTGASAGSKRTTIPCDLMCVAFAGQGAYELAYQAGFEFEMSADPLSESKVMVPVTQSWSNHGVSFFVVGELTGQKAWQERIRAGEEAGARAVQSRQTSTRD
jgi:sarcosine oxidase subunit alpha